MGFERVVRGVISLYCSLLSGIIVNMVVISNFAVANTNNNHSGIQSSSLDNSSGFDHNLSSELEKKLQDLQLRLKETAKSFSGIKVSSRLPLMQKLKMTSKVSLDLSKTLNSYIKQHRANRLPVYNSNLVDSLKYKLMHFEQLILELESLRKQVAFAECGLPLSNRGLKTEIASRRPARQNRRRVDAGRDDEIKANILKEKSCVNVVYQYDEDQHNKICYPNNDDDLQTNNPKANNPKTNNYKTTLCPAEKKIENLD